MMVFRDLAEYSVEHALKLGADYAEARFQEDRTVEYVVKNGVPEVVGVDMSRGIGIRVIVNGALGFASANRPEKKVVEEAVKAAVDMARASVRTLKSPVRMSEEEVNVDRWEVESRKPLEDVSDEDKMELLMDLDRASTSVGVKVPYRLFELTEMRTVKHFVNSDGARVEGLATRILFAGFLTAFEAGTTEQDIIEVGGSGGWEVVEGWSLVDKVSERTETLGRILREAKPTPKGKLDLVLGSQVVGLVVHESVGHPYEADRILGREAAQAGESFVKPDMLGQKIGSDVATVVDDPTIEGSYGYYLYDDEGVRARRRYLMKNGVINEFLHNRETAAEMGFRSNASARACRYDVEPLIRMANTFMLPGDMTFEELLEDVKLGVYMKTFGEWNIDDRRFNMRFVGRECYLIRNGELAEMVRRPTLEITTPALYRSIDAVDRNLKFEAATCGKGDPVQGVPVWHGGPNVRLRGIVLR